ncbi:hypothetical protein JXB02_01735 [Candidatus Woesearchaeota archaeon]|nr:hypothetical protein [Candidatus Woesearchaeota archaeon]
MPFNQGDRVVDLGAARESAEHKLALHRRHDPITLVIPATYADAISPAMLGDAGQGLEGIVSSLSRNTWISSIVIPIDGLTGERAYKDLKSNYQKRLGDRVTLVWNLHPQIHEIRKEMKEKGANIPELDRGKGANVWTSLLYLHTVDPMSHLMLHDADILTYDSHFVENLAMPLMYPKMGFDFIKAYYQRLKWNEEQGKHQLFGRALRLGVRPLILSLSKVFRDEAAIQDYLSYLSEYKYLTSGEFAMSRTLWPRMPVPPLYDLEIGQLTWLHNSPWRCGQVDLGVYDHKHQDISVDDPTRGLHRMFIDITKSVFRRLYQMGYKEIVEEDMIEGISDYFESSAFRLMDSYKTLSHHRDYWYDYVEENIAIRTFSRAVIEAYEEFRAIPYTYKPLTAPLFYDSKYGHQIAEVVRAINR